MGSKVFSYLASFVTHIITWFDESFFGKCYNRFCAWCYRVYKESHLSRFFDAENDGAAGKSSFFGKLVRIPENILLFLRKKLSNPINRVIEKSAFCSFVSRWADTSIRFYGIVLLVFSVLTYAFCELGKIELLASGFLLVVSLLCILINRSLRGIFGGSLIFRSIVNLFYETKEEKCDFYPCGVKQTVVAAVLGAILSFFAMSFGFGIALALLLFLIGAVFLIKYLPLGVFLTVVFSPMLPTMVLVALSFMCAGIFCIHVLHDEKFTFSKSSVNTAVWFFIIALIWGCINSFNFVSSASQVAVHLSFILFYFVVLNTIRTKKQWMALVKLFLLSAFVVALYGIAQNFLGVDSAESWVDEEMFEDIKVRVYSFFNNPNVLGEFLVLTIPMTLAVIWGKAKISHKTLFGFVLISMAACMIFTWSRGAWLGVFFAVALLLVIMDKRWVFVGILGLIAVPLLLVLSGHTAILDRLLSIGNTADTSTAYRVSIWQASVKMIRDFWVSGIGIGSESYKSVYPVYALAGADFALHSHNLYLQTWVEMGILGITSLLALLLTFVRKTFSKAIIESRKKDNTAKMVIAMGTGVLGFMLQGLTDYVWYNYKILMIFWLLVALAVSGANIVSESVQLLHKKGGDEA
ncbi:MAG: O-antigen ligase family protein [Clostridia bacterium]|nr:O-antigen ligase family protein [Clostridia bacterium]